LQYIRVYNQLIEFQQKQEILNIYMIVEKELTGYSSGDNSIVAMDVEYKITL